MRLHDLFSDKNFYQKLLRLACPLVLQFLMLAMVAAADAFMLGRLDQDSMAAVSLATQIQFIQNMFFWAISGAIAVLGAQYWGKKDLTALKKIFGLSMGQGTLTSLFFWAGCLFCPEVLMKIFAKDANLIQIGAEYLRWSSWSYILAGVSQNYLAVMKVSDHASRTAWISSVTVIINIVLNTIFIFGLCGAPAMGVRGAAFATVLSRAIELVWCMESCHEKSFIPLEIKHIFHWDMRLLKDFWRCGLPILGSSLVWGIGFTSYTAILGHLGSDAAAANSIAAVVRDLICCACDGLCVAGSIVVGNELGAGNLAKGKLYGQRLMYLSYLIGCLSTVLILASLPPVLWFVKLTDVAQSYLSGMFIILSIYMIGRCVNTITINGVFSAGGDTLFDLYSLLVVMWGLAVPCAFIAAFYLHWNPLVVYACTCLDEVGKIPWVMCHFHKYKWVRNLTR